MLIIYFEIGNMKKKIEDLFYIMKGILYCFENLMKNMVCFMFENEEIGIGKILMKNGKMYVEIVELKR